MRKRGRGRPRGHGAPDPPGLGAARRRGTGVGSGHARPAAPASDRERAAHLVAQAASSWFSGDPAGAGRYAEEAQALAVSAGFEREARSAVAIKVMVAHSTGEWPSAVQNGLAASLLSPDVSEALFDGHFCVSEYALTSGDPLDGIRAVSDDLHAKRSGRGPDAHRSSPRPSSGRSRSSPAPPTRPNAPSRGGEAEPRDQRLFGRGPRHHAARRIRLRPGRTSEADALFADALVISRWSPMSSHLCRSGTRRCYARPTTPSSVALSRRRGGLPPRAGHRLRLLRDGVPRRGDDRRRPRRAGRACDDFLAGAEAISGLWRRGPWPAALDEARGELALASGDAGQAAENLAARATPSPATGGGSTRIASRSASGRSQEGREPSLLRNRP